MLYDILHCSLLIAVTNNIEELLDCMYVARHHELNEST